MHESPAPSPAPAPGHSIVVNGEPRQLDRLITVRELLDSMGLGAAPCAVEVNAALVPRKRHDEQRLADGDRVEIVTLVGGG